MLFNSFQFLLFLAALFPLHFLLPHRFRLPLLFVASYYFYMCWDPWYVLLIAFVTLVSYAAAIMIEISRERSVKIFSLVAALVTCFGLLFFYKYLNFAIRTVNDVAAWAERSAVFDPVDVILPVGISFFTFQALSYVIDVYLKRMPAERNPVVFATFVSFFPQLVAGPIERAENLLPQIMKVKRLTYSNVRVGLEWMLWGLFKKVVIADAISVAVNRVYAAPQDFSGPVICLATVFFAIQIYCDFSGYSDIAVGVAKLFDVDLMINFRQPYLARSISEFWQRWHISLTTWFRDYVYIPLGGNRVGLMRWAFNVLAVFLLSGAWHGANWTFIIWGLLHSFYFFLQRATQGPVAMVFNALRLYRIPFLVPLLEWAATMFLVMIGWVFFRAESVDKALAILARSADFSNINVADFFWMGLPRLEMTLALTWIAVLMVVDYALCKKPRWAMALWENRASRWMLYLAGFYIILFFGVFDQVDFIYFQF